MLSITTIGSKFEESLAATVVKDLSSSLVITFVQCGTVSIIGYFKNHQTISFFNMSAQTAIIKCKKVKNIKCGLFKGLLNLNWPLNIINKPFTLFTQWKRKNERLL